MNEKVNARVVMLTLAQIAVVAGLFFLVAWGLVAWASARDAQNRNVDPAASPTSQPASTTSTLAQ